MNSAVLDDHKTCLECGFLYPRRGHAWIQYTQRQFCSRACAGSWSRARTWRDSIDRSGGPNACWPWTGCRNRSGYGKLSVGHGARSEIASREAWRRAHGAVPSGLFVCHTCDNPPCCNPAHLFLGTVRDNARDMVAKGRENSGSRNPMSKLTDGDVAAIRALRGAMPHRQIAARYGIADTYVTAIMCGQRWSKAKAFAHGFLGTKRPE